MERNTNAVRANYSVHLEELFTLLEPKKIGADYAVAHMSGDRDAMIRTCAAYYRGKAAPEIPEFSAGEYNREIADKASHGIMREINIDWVFPKGRVDFLFNPTLEHPPVNHEWLWQFNRHSFWGQMARAYADTKDESYATVFCEQLLTWIAQAECPAENWNSPGSAWRTIECGVRLLSSWHLAFNLFRRSENFTDEAMLLMLASMHRQAKHLIDHPTSHNWLMMECTGAYDFGSLYPEFRNATQIRTLAGNRLTAELEEQVLPDGMQYELSPDYHSVTFGCAAGLYRTAKALGREGELPPSYLETLNRMALASVAVSTPGFTQPRSNDTYTIPTAYTASFAETIFPDVPEFAFVNSKRTRGTAPVGGTTSRYLPFAGFAVMRSDWGPEANYLCFDVGPLGLAHAHQDKLNINIYKGGEELIVDDGGGQYEVSSARDYGISAYDHNTVFVDGVGQYRREPKKADTPIDAAWISNESFDYARGVYEDTFGTDMRRTATVTREIRFAKPGFFCVRDTAKTADEAPHSYELRFHMDTVKVDAVPEIPGAFLSDTGRTYDVLIVPISNERETKVAARVTSGQTEPEYLGWYIGRNEHSNHPAATLQLISAPVKEHRFLTLIFPMKRSDALPKIKICSDGTLRVTFGGKTYTLSPDALDR